MKISSVENSLIHLFLDDPKGDLCLAADEHVGTFFGVNVKTSLKKTLKNNVLIDSYKIEHM